MVLQMSRPQREFTIEKETLPDVKKFADSENAYLLCCIAPFAPTRVNPSRSVFAAFSFPDEFIVEDFVELVCNSFPQKKDRPTLHLLIHSPGGTVSSSYVVSSILRNCFNKIIGYVPHLAASGASVMALSCDELILGDISRLTGFDPYHEQNGGDIEFSLSTVRAFSNLVKYFRTRTLAEAPYPYQHLMKSITAEKYDEATHMLRLVAGYAEELMEKAGYKHDEIGKIVEEMLFNVKAHEEVFMLERLKELGVKAKHYREDKKCAENWKTMKNWLRTYYLKPSPIHVIKYAIPEPKTQEETVKEKKD